MQDDLHFTTVYESYKNLVFNLSLHYLGNKEDAQDITQEVFVKIHQHLHKYDPTSSSLKTWIYRITINQNLDFLKARRTKKRFGLITSLFHPDSNELLTEVSHFDHPGIALENKKELEDLFRSINCLPDRQKTALILSKIEDRPQREVAEIMNLGVKAVESLIQRAKANLSKILNETKGN